MPINGVVIATSSVAPASSSVRSRVLLADDHPAMLTLTAAALASEYLVVGSVGDGRALLAEAERLHPDVIVLDITMPRLDGIQAATQLLRSPHPARLVFPTVHEDPTSPELPWMRVRSVMSLRHVSLPSSCWRPGSARRSPFHLTDNFPIPILQINKTRRNNETKVSL